MENLNEIEDIGFKSSKIIKFYTHLTILYSIVWIFGVLIAVIDEADTVFLFTLIVYVPLPMYYAIKLFIVLKMPDVLIKTDNKYLYFWYRGKYKQIEIKRISKIDIDSHRVGGRRGSVSIVDVDGILILWENNVRYKIDCIKNVGQVKFDIDHERNKPKKKTTQG